MKTLQIRKALRRIRKIYAECQRGSDAAVGVYEWLCDNYYLYEREGKWARRELSRVNDYNLGDRGERLRGLCREITESKRRLTDGDIKELLKQVALTAFEIDFLPAFYREALVLTVSDSLLADTPENREKIGYATRALSAAGGIDTYTFAESISPIEDILLSDPAGVYPKMSKETRAVYRRRVGIAARNAGLCEENYARQRLSLAKEDNKHIGNYLNLGVHNAFRGKFFLCMEALLPLALALGVWRLCGSLTLAVVSYLPLWALCAKFVNRVALNNVPPDEILRMDKSDKSVTEAEVLIAVSTLLPEAESADKLKARLKILRSGNPGEHTRICVLADPKPAKSEKCAEDASAVRALQKCIAELNAEFGGGFLGIVRPRVYSKTGDVFSGHERKRGAVEGLIKLIKGVGSERDYLLFCGNSLGLKSTQYILVLDSDTDLPMDTVADLVSVAKHPINAEKYGVFVPAAEVKISDAVGTRFAEIFAGSGGISAYNGAGSERYQDLFGYSVFSGKGLISVDSFYESFILSAPDGLFKAETVLSHDVLEGEILGTRFVSDTSVAEGFPSDEISYLARQDRWVRGDFQNSVFIFGKLKNGRPLRALSRYKLFDNLRRPLTAVMQVAALIVSGFVGARVASVTAVLIFLSLEKPIDIFLLFQYAYTNLTAAGRALWRRFVSHRKMLEWVTAAQAEKKNSFGGVLLRTLPSIAGGAVLLCLPGLLKLYGAAFLLNPLFCYYTGQRRHDIRTVGWTEREKLTSFAAAAWKYYDSYAGSKDNYLPPDNVQETPVYRVAHRTSPTNIGFAMLCTLSACDFGFIDVGELALRLDRILSSVEKLKKYRGNLLNWYDTVTLEPLRPEYVSTVDSGNFLCLMTALVQGLREYEKHDSKLRGVKIGELIKRCRKIIDETDISFLYDKSRKLFYIGYNVAEKKFSESYYDLLMSEARMTGYYAIAKRQVPKEHWAELSRIMSKSGGHFGPLSWTGTMFEFYLPHLLLPIYKNSLSEKAVRYCDYCQQRRAAAMGIPFGMSESGFYAFDRDLNYQYKAHGVQKLGLKRGLDRECVVSPYSTFMMLPFNHRAALKNLERLADMEMVGKCGFYEAVDFTPRRTKGQDYAIVRSYMAHHVGMTMLSLANAAFNNIMQNRFMSDSEMIGAQYLLMEKVPKHITVFRDVAGRKEPAKPARSTADSKRTVSSGEVSKSARVYTNGEWSLLAFSNGMTRSLYRGIDITVPPENSHDAFAGVRVFINGDTSPQLPKKTVYRRSTVSYLSQYGKTMLTVSSAVHPRLPGEIRRLTLRNTGKDTAHLKLYVWANPLLAERRDGMAHPAFTKLFMEDSVRLTPSKTVHITKNSSEDGQMTLVCGFLSDEDVKICTSNLDFHKRRMSQSKMSQSTVGSGVPDPCAAFELSVDIRPGKTVTKTFFMCAAADGDEAAEIFRKAGSDVPLLTSDMFAPEIFDDGSPEKMIYANLLSELLCPYRLESELSAVIKKTADLTASDQFSGLNRFVLWKFGISGDKPILFQPVNSSADLQNALTCIRMIAGLKHCGISIDLVLCYDEKGNYEAPIRHELEAMILGAGEVVFGNIFAVDAAVHEGRDIEALKAAASKISGNLLLTRECDEYSRLLKIGNASPLKFDGRLSGRRKSDYSKGTLMTENGFFEGHAYHITKSPLLPWCICLANQNFGTLVSDSGLGYTWAMNSRENKLTKHNGFAWQGDDGERLLVMIGNKCYDILKGSAATFEPTRAVYCSVIRQCIFRVTVYVPSKGMTKRISVSVKNTGGELIKLKLGYYSEPVLGTDRSLSKYLCGKAVENGMIVTNKNIWGIRGFAFFGITDKHPDFMTANSLDVLSGNWESRAELPCAEPCVFVGKDISLDTDECTSLTFSQSFAACESAAVFLGTDFKAECPSYEPKLLVHTQNQALDIMVNTWLPMQMKNSRMFGRCGFYQSGGAFGFRDQLQDAMNIQLIEPKLARQFILRCAASQFPEGDVLHWWHSFPERDGGIKGIRTRCSDDMLWLPLAIAEYVSQTGDKDFAFTKVSFVEGAPLGENERERYAAYKRSEMRATMYEHGKRALYRGLNLSERGLVKIGTCDWNDGYSAVGEKGRGESIWLSMFAALAAEKYADFAEEYMSLLPDGDHDFIEEMREASRRLKEAVDKTAWDGDWYIRAVYDDGEVMGSYKSAQCKIDSLPQSFATLCDMPDKERRYKSLINAVSNLYDEEHGVVRLFWPPFTPDGKRTGYVNFYAPGTRENGGQYTHAAVWLALSLLRHAKEADKAEADVFYEVAYSMLRHLNPAEKYLSAASADVYLGEPYALAGDVYSVAPYCGRAGWTLYTGAAGWYYRTIVGEMLGIGLKNGELRISPALPPKLGGYTAEFTANGEKHEVKFGQTLYNLDTLW